MRFLWSVFLSRSFSFGCRRQRRCECERPKRLVSPRWSTTCWRWNVKARSLSPSVCHAWPHVSRTDVRACRLWRRPNGCTTERSNSLVYEPVCRH